MFDLFHFRHDIPFMRYGRVTTTISLVTFLLAVIFLVWRGLNLGIEFTGGTVLEVRTEQPADLSALREAVESIKLGSQQQAAQLQALGTTRDVAIRLPNLPGASSAQISNQVMERLRLIDPKIEQRKIEFIGPSVGNELVQHGLIALTIVCLGIMAYLALRFEWCFALSAVIANMHDVVIILGCFALFQWEFSLTVLAAVLAVLGYSVNESVVVFDRIRENFRKAAMRGKTIPDVIDNAITATMSRTVITHGSTQMMVLAILLFGGPSLHYFALALTIGICFGIYSSVLVASPLLLLFGVSRENLLKPERASKDKVMV